MKVLKKPNIIVWIMLFINVLWLFSYNFNLSKTYAIKFFFLYIIIAYLLVFANHQKWNKEFFLSTILIIAICYLFEFIALKSGLIIGNFAYNYRYLYSKMSYEGVPIFNSLFCFLVLYLSRFTAQFLSKDLLLASAISSVISTFLIYLFYHFLKANYIFIAGGGITGKYWYVSFVLFFTLTNYIIYKSTKPNQNKMSNYVLLLLLGFLVVLYFI